jgi:hypothetical protein
MKRAVRPRSTITELLWKGGSEMRQRTRASGTLRRAAVAGLLAVAMVSTGLNSIAGKAATSTDVDASVITSWNATAVSTIVVDAGKANVEAFIWLAFVHAAMYNAVEGITRDYELYQWNQRGPRSASPEAAAAAAAHRLLLYYFPASKARLDAALTASLASVQDGSDEMKGVVYGERAADRIIELRMNDGRNAPLPYDKPPGPGVWEPTPPTFTPFFGTWISRLLPMTLESPSQFRPGPPPALTSAQYTADFNEVKAFGSKTNSSRTDAQTETAWFFSDTAIGPLQAAFRDLATRHSMDISDAARMFAVVEVSIADASIATWDAKFTYGFWRPITAIQRADTDGNPDTAADPTWEPLFVTPPYPDYTSGLTSVVGSSGRALSRILGNGRVDLNITSIAAGQGGPPVTRHYELASTLNADAIDARMYLGIHFRTADAVGNQLGATVADWVMDHEFQPI